MNRITQMAKKKKYYRKHGIQLWEWDVAKGEKLENKRLPRRG